MPIPILKLNGCVFCDYVSGEVVLDGPVDYKWIYPAQIREFALPKANLKFIDMIYQNPALLDLSDAC